MFLRTNKAAWGIGLLTVTSAILLDAFLTVLGREEMLEELGFFFYVIVGALIAGAAIWLWASLRDFVFQTNEETTNYLEPMDTELEQGDQDFGTDEEGVFRETRELAKTLTNDDLQDLLFDLGYQEEEFISLTCRDDLLIRKIIQLASERNELESVRIAIERIKHPIPVERLPRLEKLTVESPPTVFRQFLLSNYSAADFDQISGLLGVEDADSRENYNKKKVRDLLSELYKRKKIGSLIEVMKDQANSDYGDNSE